MGARQGAWAMCARRMRTRGEGAGGAGDEGRCGRGARALRRIVRGARGTADERCGGGKASGDGVGVGSGQQRG